MNDGLLVAGILALVFLLWLWHMDKSDAFDLRWLIVDTATVKVSLFKLGQLVALLTTTWMVIYETRSDRLTEWLFMAYAATWAGANVANRLITGKQNDQGGKP